MKTPQLKWYMVSLFFMSSVPALAAEFHLEPVIPGAIFSAQDVTFPQFDWNDLGDVWNRTTGKGVIVAVIDSGIDLTHPDLVKEIEPRWPGWNFIKNNSNVSDEFGHGTLVASLIAGAKTGVAPDAKIISLKVAGADGGGTDEALDQAITYAVAHGIRIINISMGDSSAESQAMKDALAYAEAKDVLIVASGGNSGDNDDTALNLPATAGNSNIICAGGLDKEDGPSEASNYGPHSMHLMAKVGDSGDSINGAWFKPAEHPYQQDIGTSVAAPLIAGTAALMLQLNPKLSAAQMKQILMDSGRSVPALQGKTISGKTLDISAAVAATPR